MKIGARGKWSVGIVGYLRPLTMRAKRKDYETSKVKGHYTEYTVHVPGLEHPVISSSNRDKAAQKGQPLATLIGTTFSPIGR